MKKTTVSAIGAIVMMVGLFTPAVVSAGGFPDPDGDGIPTDWDVTSSGRTDADPDGDGIPTDWDVTSSGRTDADPDGDGIPTDWDVTAGTGDDTTSTQSRLSTGKKVST